QQWWVYQDAPALHFKVRAMLDAASRQRNIRAVFCPKEASASAQISERDCVRSTRRSALVYPSGSGHSHGPLRALRLRLILWTHPRPFGGGWAALECYLKKSYSFATICRPPVAWHNLAPEL